MPIWAFNAEGARLGITSCSECGAALLINAFNDVVEMHKEWHKNLILTLTQEDPHALYG